MRTFIRNLALLVAMLIALLIIAPDMMRQVAGIYNGLGILLLFIIILIVSALPRSTRRRRR